MVWKNWNKADKTLLAAFSIFLFSLCLHIQYPGNIMAEGLLFCSEAALVGGIADWFAVTALFKKPLGFPWHTALLPRRKQAFIDATGKMLQKEFFTPKLMLSKLEQYDFIKMLQQELEQEQQQKKLQLWLKQKIAMAVKENISSDAESIDKYLKEKASPEALLNGLGENEAVSHGIITGLGGEIEKRCSEADFFHFLEKQLIQMKEDKLAQLPAFIAPRANMMAGNINLSEVAEVIQGQCVRLGQRLQSPESVEHQRCLAEFKNILCILQKNEETKQDLDDLWWTLLQQLSVFKLLQLPEVAEQPEIQHIFDNVAAGCISSLQQELQDNRELQEAVYSLWHQFSARGVLQAREMIDGIVRDVLSTMTDQQMNRLIYEKAEPDLLWIRMNGSIVGASIGIVVFAVIQIFTF